IGFIGCGKMGCALISSILKNTPYHIIGSDRSEECLKTVKSQLKIQTTTDNKELAKKSSIIFLSVKPQDMNQVLKEIKQELKNQLIVSIAAGITIKTITAALKYDKVIRVMPNTPCLVGEMAAGYSCGKAVTKDEAEAIKQILSNAGMAFEVEEKHLDAITALSGSGPAFFAAFIKSFADAAAEEGLPKAIAVKLACQTALGTGKLLLEKNMQPEELIAMVSSPGGTTVAGLHVLEKNRMDSILAQAYKAAVQRSRELGK
ncbi:pyrroline-5-carboxylate reductase, partial [Candidatus Woesearchaeota archaeon]|nr:pyrroline-5-carboxylate reductase [Candidatus Woesearchaeota archaeon]